MTGEGTPVAPLKDSRWQRIKGYVSRHRQQILIIAGGVVVLAALVIGWWRFNQPPAVKKSPELPKAEPVPVTVEDPLTGTLVDADKARQPVTAVMIENLYPDARPQSGLSEAGIVYEALSEGGITRFMALFQAPFPSVIGPVRSVRPYYADWASEYNIPLVHAGGSQPGLAKVQASGYKNVDALVQSSGFYRAKNRAAPHNLYSTNDKLSALLEKLKYNTAPSFTGLPRKDDTPPAAGIAPQHSQISITFGTSRYNVVYDYDAALNSYRRSNGGSPQIDRNNNAQVVAKNVVVEFVPVSYSTQSNGKPETDYKLVGSGKAYIFEDGNAVVGTWKKDSDSAPTTFLDGSGAIVKFNRGSTWIAAVPDTNTVTYQ